MKKIKPIIRLRGFLLILVYLFLAWSSWDLMKNPEELGSQLGFGAGYLMVALFSIQKRIYFLRDKKIPKIKLNRMKKDFKNFYTIYAGIFALFTTLLFVLNGTMEIPSLISCSWLLGLILATQGACFLYLANYVDKHKPENLLGIFWGSFIVISAIFGWVSAQIAYNILKIPMADDLFTVTYGQLILPIIFILYFDYVFDYGSKNTYLIKDVHSALSKNP